MKRIFLMISILTVFLTGCWNRRELNELGIALAMGFDKAKNGEIHVSVQVVDPGMISQQKGGGGQGAPVTIYSADGKTVFEAIRKMTKDSPRKIYPSHLRMLIISESLARDGIGNVLDLLSRDWELRSDFFIAIAKNMKAEQILRVSTPIEKIPANKMYQSLETSSNAWAPSRAVTLDDLIADIISKGKQPVLTGIYVKGDPKMSEALENIQEMDPKARLQYNSLAVLRFDKLIGWLTDDESKSYNKITNNLKSTVVNIKCPKGGKVAIQVIRSKAKIKGEFKNGNPRANVEIKMEGNVGEVACDIDLTKTGSITQLENAFNHYENTMIKNSIKKVQKSFHSDIFGFGEVIRRSNPDYWNKVAKDWDEHFAKLPVEVKVHMKIRRVGTVGNSFMELLRK
ncbi:Ger(x)C family spore germination protein [Bacillus sp. BRMEA1]|uniref:Ger(x)C family spore germination protein n=1 Tax=Neobacillus endophyticus TaxID=2738405 RepID=UPI001565CD17|nr:Ger(x)C family spore germination protein [Neobacillus endophyticus]NRD80107.1 Ger(x)C family spore germination protein [Neobacillus endophyticus]